MGKRIIDFDDNLISCSSVTVGRTLYPFWSERYSLQNERITVLAWQIASLSLFPHLLHYFLKHLGQPLFVSQVLGGIIFGPSFLGSFDVADPKTLLEKISNLLPTTMFSNDSHKVLDTLAVFGSMFFLFKVGVKTDPTIIRRSGMKAITIGSCSFIISLTSGLQAGDLIKEHTNWHAWVRTHDPTRKIVIINSMTSYPVIACALTDLNIINSDIGYLATSSAMVTDILHMVTQSIFMTIRLLHLHKEQYALYSFLSLTGMIAFIFCILRPAMLWIVRITPEGKPVKEIYIFCIFVLVLICGFISEYIGQNVMIGAFLFGLAVPDGPPLGAAVVDKLESLVGNLLMPLHLGVVGLKIELASVQSDWLWRELIIILTCLVGKFVGIIFPALYFQIPVRDTLLLGLIMNMKGIVELAIINVWSDARSIEKKIVTVMIFAILFITMITTPLVRYLYDPTKRYLAYKKRSITNSENNSEFRILVCVHDQEDVPPILKLLDISIPRSPNSLCIYLLHLVELIGRSSPLLISHPRKQNTCPSTTTKTERIVNTFLHFEERYQSLVLVQPFSTISSYSTMHNDICKIGADKRTFLIIYPFQKTKQNIDGTQRSSKNHSILIGNLLKQAPCSVGILVNHTDNHSITNSINSLAPSAFHVVLFFFGGIDDREALAYAMNNIVENPSVILTVVRFVAPHQDHMIKKFSTEDSLKDNAMIECFRLNMTANGKAIYNEEEVKDGAETSWAVQSMKNEYDLIIVGRRQSNDSNLIKGLDVWKEYEELGVIGDLIASSDFDNKSSLLVVQKQDD